MTTARADEHHQLGEHVRYIAYGTQSKASVASIISSYFPPRNSQSSLDLGAPTFKNQQQKGGALKCQAGDKALWYKHVHA
jgi:hypothetical protein